MARIAILDDSEDALELFVTILQGDHDYLTFTDAREFLKGLRNDFYSLILLDLVMPGTDGFAVFQEIRKIDADVPVVAVTAAAQSEERRRALAIGFCDYFIKPIIDIEEFRTTVHSHIGKCAKPLFRTG